MSVLLLQASWKARCATYSQFQPKYKLFSKRGPHWGGDYEGCENSSRMLNLMCICKLMCIIEVLQTKRMALPNSKLVEGSCSWKEAASSVVQFESLKFYLLGRCLFLLFMQCISLVISVAV